MLRLAAQLAEWREDFSHFLLRCSTRRQSLSKNNCHTAQLPVEKHTFNIAALPSYAENHVTNIHPPQDRTAFPIMLLMYTKHVTMQAKLLMVGTMGSVYKEGSQQKAQVVTVKHTTAAHRLTVCDPVSAA